MTPQTQQRWHLLDTLRGFTVIQMVLFHLLYDIFVIYGGVPWTSRLWVGIWQQSICCSFILIAGICVHFSRSLLKKGILLHVWGLVITTVTRLVIPDETIWFGILTFLGTAMLFAAVADPFLKKIRPLWGICLALGLFLLLRHLPDGYIGLGSLWKIRLPQQLYQWFPCALLGFPPADFYSSDYFPLLPWLFLFLTGYYLFFFLNRPKPVSVLTKIQAPPLSFIGRHALIIYLLHQPAAMLICMATLGRP